MHFHATLVTTLAGLTDVGPAAAYPKVCNNVIFPTHETASDPQTGLVARFGEDAIVYQPDYVFTQSGLPMVIGRDYSTVSLSDPRTSFVFVSKIPSPGLLAIPDAEGCSLVWSHSFETPTSVFRNGELLATAAGSVLPGEPATYRDTVQDRTPGTTHVYQVQNKYGNSTEVSVTF